MLGARRVQGWPPGDTTGPGQLGCCLWWVEETLGTPGK